MNKVKRKPCKVKIILSFLCSVCLAAFSCTDEDAESGDAGTDVEKAQDAASTDADADADADVDTDADADADIADSGQDAGPKSGCGNGAAGGYDKTITIDFFGNQRTYRLIVPESYDHETPSALLLSFHDYGEQVDNHMELTGLKELAEKENFMVLAIQGAPNPDSGLPAWNTGMEHSNKADDIFLTPELLKDLFADWCIDEDRVYLHGFGMGAFLASRLMFIVTEMFAAYQIESGGVKTSCRSPSGPRSLSIIHGENDGIFSTDYAEEARDYWVGVNEMDPVPVINDAGCEVYSHPDLDDIFIRYCIVEDMGHARAGIASSPEDGTMAPFNASDFGWKFLSRFSRPEP